MKKTVAARLFTLVLSAALAAPASAQMNHDLPAVQIQGQDYQYSGPASVPAGVHSRMNTSSSGPR